MKGMIFAAGLGSRLKPWTDHHPKALALVNGRSLLQRNIQYLQKHGIRELIVNVHHFAGQIIDAVKQNNGWGSDVTISDETDQILETGGGLKKAAWYFESQEDFVVMNADILTDMDLSAMISRHTAGRALATLAVSDRDTSRYFLFDRHHRLSGWCNVKTGEEKIARQADPLIRKAFSGIQVIHTDLLKMIGRDGKFSMVDVYLDLAKDQNILAYDHTGCQLIDAGRPESILKAETLFP